MFETLRKFGLSHCDLPTMIWNIDTMLRPYTFTIDPRNKKPLPASYYVLSVSATCCYIYVYIISLSWFVFYRCQQTGDTTSALMVLSLGIAGETGTSKLIFMLLQQGTIRKIIDAHLSADSLVDPGSRFARNLTASLRAVKRRALIFFCSVMFIGVFYIAKAMLTPGRHLMDDNFVFYGMEPMFETPNYQIALIIDFVSITFAVYGQMTITSFFIILVGYTEAQMTALSEEIIHIYDDAKQYKRENEEIGPEATVINDNQLNQFIKSRLETIVKIHTMDLEHIHQIENLLRGAMAVEFMFLIVGVITELACGLEHTYVQLPYTLMPVAMDCLIGQRLTDSSKIFANAVYDCKWENFDVKNRKIVLLILQNAQKEIALSTGGITKLSFRTFMSVVRLIYSAYTSLRSTMI